MLAIIYHQFGKVEVLELGQVATPTARPGQVLVKVQAAGLNPKDTRVRLGRMALFTGRRFPKLLGYDFAGVVDSVPPGTDTELKAGDRVFGMRNGFAGCTVAEYLAVPGREFAPIPEGLDFVEAASLPLAAMTALQALRPAFQRALPQFPGRPEVLLHGASGGVGVHAIQIAKILGGRVTTTSSAANLEFCRSLGADETLDYRVESGLEQPGRFDVVFDIFGNRRFDQARSALRPRGTYVSTVPSGRIIWDWLRTLLGSQRARLVVVHSRRSDLDFVSQAVVSGRLRPVVDRVFPLDRTAEAQAYIETKRARGKVVIAVAPEVGQTRPGAI
jgi:NADPH:quinone reductase-like Zn-dependent oxidoreductase